MHTRKEVFSKSQQQTTFANTYEVQHQYRCVTVQHFHQLTGFDINFKFQLKILKRISVLPKFIKWRLNLVKSIMTDKVIRFNTPAALT